MAIFVASARRYFGKSLAILETGPEIQRKSSKWNEIIALFLCGSEQYFYLAGGDAFLAAWFPTAMCDLHHRRAGYMTHEAGYMTQNIVGWDGGGLGWAGHASAEWMVLSRVLRVKGFSSRVMSRFKTSRSAISSPV